MLRAASDHFSHTDPGRQRRANEDAYFARAPVFVVADGMGGAQAGEVASRLAVEAFQEGVGDETNASPEELLAARIREANGRIHVMSQRDEQRAGMGTTLTAAHVGEYDVAVAHVGDSRAYRLRDGALQRLTEDHSLVEEMRRRGQLTAEEADEHPQRSIITRALGPEPDVDVDTHSWRGEAGDVFLLCSDGLTSMISDARVADIVRAAPSLQQAGRALVAAANEAGGRDNITVILFRLEEVEGPADASTEQATVVGSGAITTAQVRAAATEAPPQPAAPPGPAAPQTPLQRLRPRSPATPPPGPGPKARRRGRLGVVLVVLAVTAVPLFVGGYIATQAVYFVGADEDGFVAMYRGVPYELPGGIDLYTVNYVSGVPVSALADRRRKRLLDHTLRSRGDAADLLRELERGRLSS